MRIGILGGGQLGRMLAWSGVPLEMTFRVFDPADDPCAGVIAEHVCGEYDDYRSLYEFSRGLDVITFEFENVPAESAHWLAERVPVYPPPAALEVSQDRLIEKEFLQKAGVPVPEFRAIDSREDFDAALREIGIPSVLKTRRFGYDGKGQRVINKIEMAESAWEQLGGRPLILEQWIPFDREVSLLAVRARSGKTVYYPLIENSHRDGILRQSTAPASEVTSELQRLAESHAQRLLEKLDYVGVLAIEWFQRGEELWANEIAPRVHNSGHWTIEGAETSQFENHVRAVAGWPLGQPAARGVSRMHNLISTLPDAVQVAAIPGAHLHWYGKAPRANRKLGHVTVWADSWEVMESRSRLVSRLIEA